MSLIVQLCSAQLRSTYRQFGLYSQMGIIPEDLDSLGHPDNLILLCGFCHKTFHHTPPYWIMLPTTRTIQQFIVHERLNYTARARAGRRGINQPRSLPEIDISGVRYPIYILGRGFAENMHGGSISDARLWLGHPVPAIIKGSLGVVTPCQMGTVRKRSRVEFSIGVPNLVRTKIVDLMNPWDWPAPKVHTV